MAKNDDLPEIPADHPRRTTELIGHQDAEDALRRAWDSGRMPHAWLFGGPEGVGKATLAYRFTRFLLAGGPGSGGLAIPATHPVTALVASAGHPDLRTVEREWDAKRQRMRGEIQVDRVREQTEFLKNTASMGAWRVLLLDEADTMNASGANALLKVLEEPPTRTVLILTAHRPGALLPTIRSRCRLLSLKPLALPQVETALAIRRPHLDAATRRSVAALAQGSIGRALTLGGADGAGLYGAILKAWRGDGAVAWDRVTQLADQAARADSDGFMLMGEMIGLWLEKVTRLATGRAARIDTVAGEGELARAIAASSGLERIVDVWEKGHDLFTRADGLNLHRRQTVLTLFTMLEPKPTVTRQAGT